MLNTNEIKHAYDTFLNIFILLFNKHCPVKTIMKKVALTKSYGSQMD